MYTLEELGIEDVARLRRGYQWLGNRTGTLVVVTRFIGLEARGMISLRNGLRKGIT